MKSKATKRKKSAVELKDLKPARDAKGGSSQIPPPGSGDGRIATNHNEVFVNEIEAI